MRRRWIQLGTLGLTLFLLTGCVRQESGTLISEYETSTADLTAEETSETSTLPTSDTEITHPITISPETMIQEVDSSISIETHPFSLPNSSDQGFLTDVTLPEGDFAVMEGEGRQYLLYDDQGNYLRSFERINAGSSYISAGIYKPEEIYRITDPYVKEEPDITDEFDPLWMSVFEFCGGYVVKRETTFEVFRRDGQKLFSNEAEFFGIDASDKEVVLFFSGTEEVNVYFLSLDGAIQREHHISSFPEDYYPSQILSDQYFIAEKVYSGTEMYAYTSSVFDMEGREIITDVERMYYGLMGDSNWNVGQVNLYPYFVKDGITYDATLAPVAPDTLDENGEMISGVLYSVGGSMTQAMSAGYTISDGNNLVAWYPAGDKLSVRYAGREITLSVTGGRVFSCTSKLILIEKEIASMQWEYLLFSFETGELLRTIKDYALLADDYVFLSVYDDEQSTYVFEILNTKGELVFQTRGESIVPTRGPFLQVQRGPYSGITTLDGTWILKGIAKEYTNDTDLPIYFD